MSKATSLKSALREESTLHAHIRDGIGAFKQRDIKLISEAERSRIKDSLELDAAAKDEYPEANRWDYILSISDLSEIVGIEPHTAKDSEISVVIAKKKHANTYMRHHLQDGHRVARWFWVSHGTVSFSKMDRARRRLDQNGIKFEGRMIRTFG
jgi:hypothetical protein